MKKNINIILSALLVFSACQKSEPGKIELPEEGKVTVELGLHVPEAESDTKALAETPDIVSNGVWVLVYEGGYRTEVVQVTDLTHQTGNDYTFKLTLSTSDSPKNLHFISMAGFQAKDAPFEETRLGSDMTSGEDVGAYWQLKQLPNIPYDAPDGYDSAAAFIREKLGTVVLVRNYAKITMSCESAATSNFTLLKFKVFNTPKSGYVAPYLVSSGNFVGKYLDPLSTSFDYPSVRAVYSGRMPAGELSKNFTLSDFIAYDSSSTAADANSEYVYEQPSPTGDNAAFIIVYGTFSGNNYYYKISIRDQDDVYYPLLRGFRFKINIKKVNSAGFATIAEAAASAGSGDITTSLEYQSVDNISDGHSRLYVSATSYTVINESTIELKYKFCPKASSSNVANGTIDVDDNNNTNGVEITVSEPLDGMLNSIKIKTAGTPPVYNWTLAGSDVDGWRTITIETEDPELLYREQIVTIRGRSIEDGIRTIIQRDVHIIVRPTLTMKVEIPETSLPVAKTAETPLTVNVGLEPNLPESIFPVNIKIEAVSRTLTPDTDYNTLPVESGKNPAGNPSFWFVKTVSYNDYQHADTGRVDGTDDMVVFPCYFKTNTAASASTINVYSDLFTTATCSFTNTTS